MSKYYVVNGIGGGFDGLIVEGSLFSFNGSPKLLAVLKIIDKNVNVGDRTLALPIPTGSLYILEDYLTETDDPGLREFASDNPFGQLLLEGHMSAGGLKVAYSKFEKVLSVVVTETIDVSDKPALAGSTYDKTIFSQYFTRNFEAVMSKIEEALKSDGDAEDLVFELRELKSKENE